MPKSPAPKTGKLIALKESLDKLGPYTQSMLTSVSGLNALKRVLASYERSGPKDVTLADHPGFVDKGPLTAEEVMSALEVSTAEELGYAVVETLDGTSATYPLPTPADEPVGPAWGTPAGGWLVEICNKELMRPQRKEQPENVVWQHENLVFDYDHRYRCMTVSCITCRGLWRVPIEAYESFDTPSIWADEKKNQKRIREIIRDSLGVPWEWYGI